MKNLLICSTAIFLSGCAELLEPQMFSNQVAFNDKYTDAIYGVEIKDDTVYIRLPTNGCTEKSHFGHEVEVIEAPDYFIRLTRITPDNCEAFMPDGTVLSYTFEELRIPADARLHIRNPLIRR